MIPKISVVLGVYNGADFLVRALESVFAQDYPAHEVIVIDDGSTDTTPDILAGYKNRIITRRIECSGGPATPKNLGMGLATGDYIAFLDHDDLWFKDKLKKQAAAAATYPSVGLISCDFAVRYPHLNNRLIKHTSVLKEFKDLPFDRPLNGEAFRVLLKGNFIGVPSAVILKREVAVKVGPFNVEYKSTQDYDYWLRCAVFTDFLMLSDVLLYKRNHPKNISVNVVRTHEFRKRILTDRINAEQVFISERGLGADCRLALAEVNYFLGNIVFEKGDPAGAFRLYIEGLAASPTLKNFSEFTWTASKKMLRVLTFNALSRENVKRLVRVFAGSRRKARL